MRIIIVGGTGTIGSAIQKELCQRHHVIVVGHSKGDLQCDMSSENSIEKMYQQAGECDGVVIASGKVHFEDFLNMSTADYHMGLNHKLMGQVNLVRIGLKYIKDNGSFTLTSGILSEDPIKRGTSASMVNGALEAFVRASAIEMPRGIRINCVSPTILLESLESLAPFFRGFFPVKAEKVALSYSKSVEGLQTGQIYKVWD